MIEKKHGTWRSAPWRNIWMTLVVLILNPNYTKSHDLPLTPPTICLDILTRPKSPSHYAKKSLLRWDNPLSKSMNCSRTSTLTSHPGNSLCMQGDGRSCSFFPLNFMSFPLFFNNTCLYNLITLQCGDHTHHMCGLNPTPFRWIFKFIKINLIFKLINEKRFYHGLVSILNTINGILLIIYNTIS